MKLKKKIVAIMAIVSPLIFTPFLSKAEEINTNQSRATLKKSINTPSTADISREARKVKEPKIKTRVPLDKLKPKVADIKLYLHPDLVVKDARIRDIEGNFVALLVDIVNQGDTKLTEPFQVKLIINGVEDIIEVEPDAGLTIERGKTRTLQIHPVLGLRSGNNNLEVRLDYDNKISETNENNNVYTKTINWQPATPPAGSIADLEAVDIISDWPLVEGQDQSIRVIVRNSGNAYPSLRNERSSLGQARILVDCRKEGEGKRYFYDLRTGEINIRAGERAAFVFQRPPPTGISEGNYRFRFIVDEYAVLRDKNLQNNFREKNLQVAAPPLTIESFSPTRTCWGAKIFLEIKTTKNLADPQNPVPVVVSFSNIQGEVEYILPLGSGRYKLTVSIPHGAPSGPITVTAYGKSVTSSGRIEIFGQPTITNISPSSCAIFSELTIRGTNFVPPQGGEGTDVEFVSSAHVSGKKAANPSSVTPSEIKVNIPEGTLSGPVTVKTVVAAKAFSCASQQALRIIPKINSFSPRDGHVGNKVRIYGTSFGLNPQVRIAGVVAQVDSAMDREIGVILPEGARTGKVKVITTEGEAESQEDFRVLVGPEIRSISPAQGPEGTVVTLQGEDLDVITSASLMCSRPGSTFGRTPIILNKSRNQAQIRIPDDVDYPGPGEISFYMPGFWSNKLPFTVTAEGMHIRTPQVYNFTPWRIAQGGRIIIEVYDLTFHSASDVSVRIGDIPATVHDIIYRGRVDGREKTEVFVNVPENATTARVNIGSYGVTGTSSDNLRVYGPITITEISPASARVGALVTIRGTNFVTQAMGEGTEVFFKGPAGSSISVPVSSMSVRSENELQVRVPVNASIGPVTITTVVGGKSFSVTSSTEFNVLP